MDKNLILKNDKLEIYDYPGMIIEINGIKYSYGLFEAFGVGGMQLNTPFQIIKREDDTIVIQDMRAANLKSETEVCKPIGF